MGLPGYFREAILAIEQEKELLPIPGEWRCLMALKKTVSLSLFIILHAFMEAVLYFKGGVPLRPRKKISGC